MYPALWLQREHTRNPSAPDIVCVLTALNFASTYQDTLYLLRFYTSVFPKTYHRVFQPRYHIL